MNGIGGRFVVRFVLLLLFLWGAFELATTFLVLPWTVAGSSMQPTLKHGDRVFVDLWSYRQRLPRVDEIVLVQASRSEGPYLVKRVARAVESPDKSPSFWLLGDNAGDSHDSRQFGAVPSGRLSGRVFWRYWPPSRIGGL